MLAAVHGAKSTLVDPLANDELTHGSPAEILALPHHFLYLHWLPSPITPKDTVKVKSWRYHGKRRTIMATAHFGFLDDSMSVFGFLRRLSEIW